MGILSVFGRPKPPLRVVVDVGSHSIKAAVFEVSSETQSNPKVIKKTVSRLPFQHRVIDSTGSSRGKVGSGDRTIAKLRELLFELVKNFERIPEQIIVALSPPLVEYSLQNWTVPPAEKEKIISRRDLSLYFYNLLAQHRDWKRMIIPYPLALTMNGYFIRRKSEADEWRPCPASCIEVASFSGLEFKGELGFQTLVLTLDEAIGKKLVLLKESLGGMPIEFVPLAATHAEGILLPMSLLDVFLIDVGGDMTILSCYKDGILKCASSFPVGTSQFVRNIAKATSGLPDDAENMKRNYSRGLLSVKQAEKIHSFALQDSGIWEEQFLETLKEFYHTGPLPEKVLVFGGGAHVPEVTAIIKRGDWFKGYSYLDMPQVRILDAQNLFSGDSLGGFLQGSEEVGLASLLIYSRHHEPII